MDESFLTNSIFVILDLRLDQLVASVHEGKKPFKCSTCGASFTTITNLKCHFDLDHEEKKPYQCMQYLWFNFFTKSKFAMPIWIIHEKKPTNARPMMLVLPSNSPWTGTIHQFMMVRGLSNVTCDVSLTINEYFTSWGE